MVRAVVISHKADEQVVVALGERPAGSSGLIGLLLPVIPTGAGFADLR